MWYDDFYDLKKLANNMGRNFNMNENGEKVKWSDVKIVQVKKEFPNIISYKTSIKMTSLNY